MDTPKTIPPTAIKLALDALWEYEYQDEIARSDDRDYIRDVAAHRAEVQSTRANVLAQIAVAQALVAVAQELRHE